MQGLSQALASMFGENDKFDDLEVAANPLGGDPLWKRVTQQIRPVLAALTDVPPAVTNHGVVFSGQRQPVPLALGVFLEEVRVPRGVVREVIAPHAVVAGPYLGCEDQSRAPAHQPGSCGGPVIHGQEPTVTRRSSSDAIGEGLGSPLIGM